MLQLPAIGITLLGGLATYVAARLTTGAKSTERPEVRPIAMPVAPIPIAKAPVREPVQAPVEHTAPPPPPPPPVDKSPHLPTPPIPAPVVIAPPPVVAPPKVVTGPAVVEPPPAPVEHTAPPPPPPPPVDVSPALPTPVVPPPVVVPSLPVRPDSDAPIIEVSARDKPPAGFDAAIASTLAPGVAKDIKTRQYDFDRAQLKRFQAAAGLTPDGVYGNDSWGALLYYTSDAPKALYKPSAPTPYQWGQWVMLSAMNAPQGPSSAPQTVREPEPVDLELDEPPAAALPVDVGPVPPSGFNPTSARKLAKQVSANIDSKAKLYSRDLLKQFQTAAGIAADGLYGGGSRRALIFFGVPRPAQPLFKPTATPAEYPWSKQAGGVS